MNTFDLVHDVEITKADITEALTYARESLITARATGRCIHLIEQRVDELLEQLHDWTA